MLYVMIHGITEECSMKGYLFDYLGILCDENMSPIETGDGRLILFRYITRHDYGWKIGDRAEVGPLDYLQFDKYLALPTSSDSDEVESEEEQPISVDNPIPVRIVNIDDLAEKLRDVMEKEDGKDENTGSDNSSNL